MSHTGKKESAVLPDMNWRRHLGRWGRRKIGGRGRDLVLCTDVQDRRNAESKGYKGREIEGESISDGAGAEEAKTMEAEKVVEGGGIQSIWEKSQWTLRMWLMW